MNIGLLFNAAQQIRQPEQNLFKCIAKVAKSFLKRAKRRKNWASREQVKKPKPVFALVIPVELILFELLLNFMATRSMRDQRR